MFDLSFFPRSTSRLSRARTALLLLVFTACSGSTEDSSGTATLAGTVRAAGSSSGLSGATVHVGTRSVTTSADGHFDLTGLPSGAASAQAERPGFTATEAALTLIAGSNSHDFTLDPQEIYHSGTYAVLVPAGVTSVRGAIVTLGGPITSGFVTGDPINPGGSSNEAGLQELGASLRALARSAHVALVGTSTIALSNSAESDNQILAVLSAVATLSGHAELATAPVVMFGLSAGAPEAAGLASRLPTRTIGLLERVPVSVSDLSSPATLAVPAFVMQSEFDSPDRNSSVQAQFSGNRSRGGLWALAVEPGADHSTASMIGNATAIGWLQDVLTLRLPAQFGDPLVALNETAGWLGNPTTHEIAAWANYTGNRTAANWLFTQGSAAVWKALVTPASGTGGGTLHALRFGVVPAQ